ncbi:MAG: hypothetical protein PHE27_06130 [Alphaproteobacteria bacterium]|nr:hypothetical protein [Alphaproteobacteria bacterium]
MTFFILMTSVGFEGAVRIFAGAGSGFVFGAAADLDTRGGVSSSSLTFLGVANNEFEALGDVVFSDLGCFDDLGGGGGISPRLLSRGTRTFDAACARSAGASVAVANKQKTIYLRLRMASPHVFSVLSTEIGQIH